jgi:hypothetical protein
MAVTYSSTVKDKRLEMVVCYIASNTSSPTQAGTAGQLVIGTSALSGGTGVLATIALSTTPGTVTGGVLTLSGVPLSVAASATGTAAKAEIRNNAGTTVISGLTVGTSGSDVIISSTSITSGQTVTVTAGTITHG